MLGTLSCWYFDWATLGTWVGGLGSAAAAFVAVYVLREGAAERQERKKALFAYLVHGVVSELEGNLYACLAAESIFDKYSKENLEALLSRFSLDETSVLSRQPEYLSVDLAHHLGRYNMAINRLITNFEKYSKARDNGVNYEIYENILLTYLKGVKSVCITLAGALIDNFPEHEAVLMRLQVLVENDDMLRDFSALAVRKKMANMAYWSSRRRDKAQARLKMLVLLLVLLGFGML